MEWYEAVEIVESHIFKISTPRGSGTGFLLSSEVDGFMCTVATAAHVIDQAHYWEENIRIDHFKTGTSTLLRQPDRAIFIDSEHDIARITFAYDQPLDIPQSPIALAPEKMRLKVGSEIGWLGFPAIPGANLCFFGGRVSSWIQNQHAYLVDGVAINGVSGGPAFAIDSSSITIIGLVSAYMPNRATGETLPGLAVVRDVSRYHELARTLKSLEQAKSKESLESNPQPPTISTQANH